MKRMRVLFVNRMAAMVRGGGETFDIEMAGKLEQLGVTVSFLCGIPMMGRPTAPLPFQRAHLLRTPYTGWFPWEGVRGGWRLRLADFWIFENRAAAWAGAHQDEFDVVQVCELPTFVRVWKRRNAQPPVVLRITAPDYADRGGGIQQADAVIASGTSMEQLRSGMRPDAHDVPNGVDTERFHPHKTDYRKLAGIAADAYIVLFVARFQVVKNHAMLIRAFARLTMDQPNARLVLVGSGPLEHEVRRQCAEAGLSDKVLFLGEVPFDDLPDIYAAADLKVISSHYESFSFAALEGMASGLPFVVTRTRWVPRLIRDGEGGYVVADDDAEAFAERMIRLARDPALRSRMGARNRQVAVNSHGWKASAEKLLALYKELAGRA